MIINVTVPGKPVQQGSKNVTRYGKVYEAAKGLPAWRRAVVNACEPLLREYDELPIESRDAVTLRVDFYFNPPKKPTYSYPPRPDLDKLIRAIGDALTISGVIRDDAQITRIDSTKSYAYDGFEGAFIQLRWAEDA